MLVYPSKVPLLYVMHLLIIALAIMFGMYVGAVVLEQPLALLLVLALNFLPELPLVPDPEFNEEAEDTAGPMYEGNDSPGPLGFTAAKRD